mmetsp:Transcript_30925/g.90407  ORF Transcript_30925/g.90407 Transcript_30925/m.90407 type:complete len:284 (+) Transcript_30925:1853-2704(+)
MSIMPPQEASSSLGRGLKYHVSIRYIPISMLLTFFTLVTSSCSRRPASSMPSCSSSSWAAMVVMTLSSTRSCTFCGTVVAPWPLPPPGPWPEEPAAAAAAPPAALLPWAALPPGTGEGDPVEPGTDELATSPSVTLRLWRRVRRVSPPPPAAAAAAAAITAAAAAAVAASASPSSAPLASAPPALELALLPGAVRRLALDRDAMSASAIAPSTLTLPAASPASFRRASSISASSRNRRCSSSRSRPSRCLRSSSFFMARTLPPPTLGGLTMRSDVIHSSIRRL